ncbi:carboxypeptidase-like regulatory domain-containing protein [Subtercola boreus]|nr:carboxypeptidase-like regulatory domain-containing protein [Subtercola boreus]
MTDVDLRRLGGFRMRGAAILAALAVAAGLVIAGPVVAQADAAEGDTLGSVSGVVFGGSSGGPRLAGVRVTLSGEAFGCDGEEPRTVYDKSVVTDSAGKFTFTDALATRTCAGESPNRVSYRLAGSAAHSGDFVARSLEDSPAFVLTPNATLSTTVVLLPSAVISGHITTTALPSVGVGGLVVQAKDNSHGSIIFTATTDAAGYFRINGLTKAQYAVQPVSDPLLNQPSPQIVEVVAGQKVTNADFQMSEKTFITGVVTSPAGKPLPNIAVSAQTAATVITSSSGRYTIGPFAGTVGVKVTYTDPSLRYSTVFRSTTAAPDTDRTIDVSLVAAATVSGTARLQSSGAPVAAVTVKLTPRYPGLPSPTATTGADGAYRFPGVAPGSYSVSFTPKEKGSFRQWWRASPTSAAASTLTVSAGQQLTAVDANINTALTLATLRGTVTLQSSPPRPDGAAIVSLVRPSDGVVIYSTTTDTAGRWSIGSVIPAPYTVRFTPSNPGFLTRWLGGSTDPAKATVVTVGTAADLSELDAALALKHPFDQAPTPTIVGSPTVGSTVIAAAGTWLPTPDAFTYQWMRKGVAIAGATNKSYAITAADLGFKLTVAVRGAKGDQIAQTKTSGPTVAVTNLGVLNGPTPTISALDTSVGTRLVAKTGTWKPDPVTLSFLWLRNGGPISGATSSTYTLTAKDIGAHISVSVTGTKAGYAASTRTSSETATVVGVLTSVPTPAIGGTPTVGSNLYVATPAWGPAPVGLTFQWKRSGSPIAGATGSFYRLAAADAGARITVTVTGTKAGYYTRSVTSQATTSIRTAG